MGRFAVYGRAYFSAAHPRTTVTVSGKKFGYGFSDQKQVKIVTGHPERVEVTRVVPKHQMGQASYYAPAEWNRLSASTADEVFLGYIGHFPIALAPKRATEILNMRNALSLDEVLTPERLSEIGLEAGDEGGTKLVVGHFPGERPSGQESTALHKGRRTTEMLLPLLYWNTRSDEGRGDPEAWRPVFPDPE